MKDDFNWITIEEWEQKPVCIHVDLFEINSYLATESKKSIIKYN